MLGGASATLVGLMFVALSLGLGVIERTDVESEERIVFVTPSIFYFVSVLIIGCIMLVPIYTPQGLAVLLMLGSVVGGVNAISFARVLLRVAKSYGDFDIWDWLMQILVPPTAYGLLLLAGIGLLADQLSWALLGLALSSVALLICGIGNTWSLVVWIMRQHSTKS
jgi:hypothetical protein